MALYLGENKVKTYFNEGLCKFNIITLKVSSTGVKLISIDGYELTDINRVHLLAKNDPSTNIKLISIDGYELTDVNGMYLLAKNDPSIGAN